MYSDKKNILQLVALLIEHGVSNIVLCPGSRNAPIVHTLANHSFFKCHSVTDERSAAFFALGLALHGGKPAAICCTSGTALLNIHPAVAEAFYQKVPLVVISSDRPEAWIGQMDGQTLPQPGIFKSLVKRSVTLPEIHNEQDEWYCNRLINEALLELNHHGKGPVHINVPISEPLFQFNTEALPKVRVINRYQGLNIYDRKYDDLIERLNSYNKRMMIAGQMSLIYLFEKKICKLLYKHFTWFSEHIGNKIVPGLPIKNFDTILLASSDEDKERLRPELVITYGGHVVSKRLKEYLRRYKPKEHWHVSLDGEVADLFGCLTTVIEMDPFEFLEKIAFMLENKQVEYPKSWEYLSKRIAEPEFDYSAMRAVGDLIHSLPAESALHLGNSSAVRYAQMFNLPDSVAVCCNRGTSGIEGSMSTAIGYASASMKPNFLVIGDLSFFYDMNSLWNDNIHGNLRILLLNNGGGEIFQSIAGLKMNGRTRRYVCATHNTTAEGWAKERGFIYRSAHDTNQLADGIAQLTKVDETNDSPMLLEIFTDNDQDIALLNDYYKKLSTN